MGALPGSWLTSKHEVQHHFLRSSAPRRLLTQMLSVFRAFAILDLRLAYTIFMSEIWPYA